MSGAAARDADVPVAQGNAATKERVDLDEIDRLHRKLFIRAALDGTCASDTDYMEAMARVLDAVPALLAELRQLRAEAGQ